MSAQMRKCENQACRLESDGKCVEGYEIKECPHTVTISVDDLPEAVEEIPSLPVHRVINLPLGDALTRVKTVAQLKHRTSRVVAIVGPNDAGKTSLLASVYDLLQEGPIGSLINFAGSSTLIGFEKICHDARSASRRRVPHMERTSAGEDATFFHLDLRSGNDGVVSLLIGDRSGEDYLGVADNLSRADEFYELHRADVITLLVNGEHLASSENRHEAKAIALQVVEALIESGRLRKTCRMAVVLTKQDCVAASPHVKRITDEFAALVESINMAVSNMIEEVEPFVVAASPKDTTNVKRGSGVGALVSYWLRPLPLPASVESISASGSRMIDVFDNRDEKV